MSANNFPTFNYLSESKLETFEILTDQINDLLNSLNINKVHGCNNISVNTFKVYENWLCEPLEIIFNNFIVRRIFPDKRKTCDTN